MPDIESVIEAARDAVALCLFLAAIAVWAGVATGAL